MHSESTSSPIRSSVRFFRLGWILRVSLGIGILIVIIVTVDLPELRLAASRAHLAPVLAAMALLPLNLWLQYRRWALIVSPFFPHLSSRVLRTALFSGLALGFATPARIGEFGGRVWAVGQDKALLVSGLTLFDKLLAQWTTLTFGFLAFAAFTLRLSWSQPAWASGSLLLALILTALGWHALRHARQWTGLLDRIPSRRLTTLLHHIVTALDRYPTSLLRNLLVLNVLFYCTFVLQFVLLLSAFHAMPLPTALMGTGTLMLVKTLIPPITLAELGIREGVAVFVFSALGTPPAAALQAALLLFTINLVIPAIIGVFFLRQRSRLETE